MTVADRSAVASRSSSPRADVGAASRAAARCARGRPSRPIAATTGRTGGSIRSCRRRTRCDKAGVRTGGNKSTSPPRTQNSPCWSTGSSRVKPASTSCAIRSSGSISSPGAISMAAVREPIRRAHTRQQRRCRGDDDARGTAGQPVQRACSRRGHVEMRRQAAVRIDFERGERQDALLGLRGLHPSSAPRKKRDVPQRILDVAGRQGRRRPPVPCAPAAAMARARAAGVRPVRPDAPGSRRARSIAPNKRARSDSDEAAETAMGRAAARAANL